MKCFALSEDCLHSYIYHFSKGSVNFKFGVIYAKKGQATDDEMLGNGKRKNKREEYFQTSFKL